MSNKSFHTLILGLSLILVACDKVAPADIDEPISKDEEGVESIVVTVQEFNNIYEDTTDSTVSYVFAWAENDTIGVFPNYGEQVAFPIVNGTGTQNVIFDEGGWELKTSPKYSAYYPIVSETALDKKNIPVDLSLQRQKGNASSDHIGKLDYMAAVNSAMTNRKVVFDFHHLVSVLHLVITVPKAGNYNRVMLLAGDDLTTKASLDLSTGKVNENTISPLQVLQLQDVNVVSDSGTLDVYMVIHPVDFTSKIFKARIYAESGEVYVIDLASRNYEAGNIYHSARTAVADKTNTGLPIVFVNTPCEQIEIKHDFWTEKSSLTILLPDGVIDNIGSMQIKGRGNSTWYYEKKPYAVKLDSKKKVLGMSKHKRWCLLANYMDRSLIRNAVSFEIAKKCPGLDWTPSGEFVELVFNGVHRGNYYLCEQIKVDKNRVNIKELDTYAIDGEGITGGYIMELDTYYDETYKFKSAIKNLPWMFKDPDLVNRYQLSYMEQYVNDMEESLYNDTKFAAREFYEYLDLESFVDWWFVNELSMNWEPNHPKSSFMHKDMNGVIKAGPVWDFDWGTFHTWNTSKFMINNSLYYDRLFQDPSFVALVKSKWAKQKSKFEEVYDYIDELKTTLSASDAINHCIWPMSTTVNGDESLTFDETVSRIEKAYRAKLKWMDTQISAW